MEKILEREVLNEEIFKKLQDINSESTKKEISPETFRNFILETGMFITYNELLNIIEFHNLPNEPSFQNIKDYQNQMPTMLQYAFRKYTGTKNISKQQTIDLISLEADRNSYHPIEIIFAEQHGTVLTVFRIYSKSWVCRMSWNRHLSENGFFNLPHCRSIHLNALFSRKVF